MQRFIVTVIASALTGAGAAAGQSAEANHGDQTGIIEELRNMVQNLQQQVDDLKSASNDNWLTQKRAEEIRSLVQDVLADADTRASLLESGVMAGWDKGFFIGSADGNWRLNIAG